MKRQLTGDAKSFVASVVGYLHKGHKAEGSIPKVATLLRKASAKAAGEGVAHVESAVVLTADERKALASALEDVLGRNLTLECSVSPGLLGGLKITVGDWVVDTSWEKQLADMRELAV